MSINKNKITYGKENRLNLKVLLALSRVIQDIHKRTSEVVKNEGLTLCQFAVLETLYHNGGMTINQIIRAILSTGGNMTVVIKNLEKDMMVLRVVNPDDRRSSLILITEKGRQKIEKIFPLYIKDLKSQLDVLEDDEKKQLINILEKQQQGSTDEVSAFC